MLVDIFEYFWLGFVITAIPGAVFFETIRRCLSQKTTVKSFLFGNFTGMIAVILLAFAGFHLVANDSIERALYLVSGVLLLYLGFSAILQNPQTTKAKNSTRSAFATGLVLAVANPLSILFWVSMSGRFSETSSSFARSLLYSLCIVVGSLAVYILLILLSTKMKAVLAPKYLKVLSMVFGIVLMVYGAMTLKSMLS